MSWVMSQQGVTSFQFSSSLLPFWTFLYKSVMLFCSALAAACFWDLIFSFPACCHSVRPVDVLKIVFTDIEKSNTFSFVHIMSSCNPDETSLLEHNELFLSVNIFPFLSSCPVIHFSPSSYFPSLSFQINSFLPRFCFSRRPGDDRSDHRLQEGGDQPWQRGHPHRCQSGWLDHPVPAGRGQQHSLWTYRWGNKVRLKVMSWRKLVIPGRFKHLLSMTTTHMWIYKCYPNQRKPWMSLSCSQENLSDDRKHFDHYTESFWSSSWTQDGSRSHVYFPMVCAGTDVQQCNVLACMLFYYISVCLHFSSYLMLAAHPSSVPGPVCVNVCERLGSIFTVCVPTCVSGCIYTCWSFMCIL